MKPDRGHIHHRLIDMGFSQKQAVATLYVISAILGLSAVVLTTIGVLRAMLFLMALCITGAVAAGIFISHNGPRDPEQVRRGTGRSQISGSENFFGEEDQSDK